MDSFKRLSEETTRVFSVFLSGVDHQSHRSNGEHAITILFRITSLSPARGF
jgi:hypothetical protein